MINRKKPELLVTAKNLEELNLLIDSGADAVAVGSELYGLRLPGDFSLGMIAEATKQAHDKNAKLYVVMNALIHNEMLEGMDDYIKQLEAFNVDSIIFGDPAVLVIAKEVAPQIPLHWNTETTATNFETIQYWTKKSISRAVLARELSLEEVIEIKQNVTVDVQVQVHGLTNIFHSKRNLVTNYLEHIDNQEALETMKEKNLFLREDKRPDEKYPVFEDRHGTHIMSSFDICMIDHLSELLNAGVDSFKIEGVLHSTDYLVKVTKLYREAIDKAFNAEPTGEFTKLIAEFQPKDLPLNTGFYYKEQYY